MDDVQYWLLKSEPTTFSIDNLLQQPQQITGWEGVRNYQARNFLRDNLKKGDLAFFYHSSCLEPGIAGIVRVVREGYPDSTQFDKNSQYYDPRSVSEKPRWYQVDIQLVKKLPYLIPLAKLKNIADLKDMLILRPGNRLSVTPVSAPEWQIITKLIEG